MIHAILTLDDFCDSEDDDDGIKLRYRRDEIRRGRGLGRGRENLFEREATTERTNNNEKANTVSLVGNLATRKKKLSFT